MTSFIETALQAALVEQARERSQFQVRPFSGNGTLRGVDLTDSASLLEVMGG